jgi:UDP-glucose 4-epimerase
VKVVVLGATGNAGTSVLRSLADEPAVESIVGVARRLPTLAFPKTTWRAASIAHDDLEEIFRGAGAVIHLAWLIQPSHDRDTLRETNVDGSARVFRAVARARVPTLVYASSVGAYSPGPKDRLVDETWPTDGIGSSWYARHKAEVERLLDGFEREHPGVRVVRLRPALLFKHEAASEIHRLFAGPLLPAALADPARIPVVPDIERLRFQAVHADDVGEAYRLAVVRDVRGAFNVAAAPILDPPALARLLDARRLPVPAPVLRAAAAVTWRLRLQPSPEGWLDMALSVPLMDTARAHEELGWHPKRGADEALLELLHGIRDSAGLATPPLAPGRPPLRELFAGVGSRSAPAS